MNLEIKPKQVVLPNNKIQTLKYFGAIKPPYNFRVGLYDEQTQMPASGYVYYDSVKQWWNVDSVAKVGYKMMYIPNVGSSGMTLTRVEQYQFIY